MKTNVPVIFPCNEGITAATALAAPVEDGMMFPEAARPPLQSFLLEPSTYQSINQQMSQIIYKKDENQIRNDQILSIKSIKSTQKKQSKFV